MVPKEKRKKERKERKERKKEGGEIGQFSELFGRAWLGKWQGVGLGPIGPFRHLSVWPVCRRLRSSDVNVN